MKHLVKESDIDQDKPYLRVDCLRSQYQAYDDTGIFWSYVVIVGCVTLVGIVKAIKRICGMPN